MVGGEEPLSASLAEIKEVLSASLTETKKKRYLRHYRFLFSFLFPDFCQVCRDGLSFATRVFKKEERNNEKKHAKTKPKMPAIHARCAYARDSRHHSRMHPQCIHACDACCTPRPVLDECTSAMVDAYAKYARIRCLMHA